MGRRTWRRMTWVGVGLGVAVGMATRSSTPTSPSPSPLANQWWCALTRPPGRSTHAKTAPVVHPLHMCSPHFLLWRYYCYCWCQCWLPLVTSPHSWVLTAETTCDIVTCQLMTITVALNLSSQGHFCSSDIVTPCDWQWRLQLCQSCDVDSCELTLTCCDKPRIVTSPLTRIEHTDLSHQETVATGNTRWHLIWWHLKTISYEHNWWCNWWHFSWCQCHCVL